VEPFLQQPADMVSEWVDPRGDPQPPAMKPPARATNDPAEIVELLQHCGAGRVYAVERWIVSGKPLQVAYSEMERWRRTRTPLAVAIETGQYDLARLLLCNGYRTELEPQSALELVLERRAWDFLELLLAWGANPKEVDPDAVLETYQTDLMERFWQFGLDYTKEHRLAHYLASSTRNKPAYGLAKRHKDDPRVAYCLALALGEAVLEGNQKATSLLLWAGADAHHPVPSLRWGSGIEDDPDEDLESAIEVAVHMGHGTLLRVLKPNPAQDDFEELFTWVCDPDAVDYLAAMYRPTDWSKAIARNIGRIAWPFGSSDESRRCLERIFEGFGGRLVSLPKNDAQSVRRDLLKFDSDWDLRWLLHVLAKPQHCEPSVFHELTRTPAMQKRMLRLGLVRQSAAKAAKVTARGRARKRGIPVRRS
jgi:hypothetical protein